MAELADAPDLGSGVNRRAGSTPVIRIKKTLGIINFRVFFIYGCKKLKLSYSDQFFPL